jgi:osmotically-inducible protein OsmY
MPFDLPKEPIAESDNPSRPEMDLHTGDPTQRDRDITSAIRSALIDDPNLSPEAKSVDVAVTDRKVVLRGRVKTEQERMDVDGRARAATGVIDVDDRIELVP